MANIDLGLGPQEPIMLYHMVLACELGAVQHRLGKYSRFWWSWSEEAKFIEGVLMDEDMRTGHIG